MNPLLMLSAEKSDMQGSFSFEVNMAEFYADLLEVAHLFFVGAPCVDGEVKIRCEILKKQVDTVFCKVDINKKIYSYERKINAEEDKLLYKRYFKRYIKLALYESLSHYLGEVSPWGSLTGIRPTKLWYDLLREGHTNPAEIFRDVFLVSKEKTELVKTIIERQKGLISSEETAADIYIGIPFCVSRCRYCSFSSGLISKYSNYIDDYVSALIGEIRAAGEIVKAHFKKIRAVYMGGGTPSSLPPAALRRILDALPRGSYELTVEAGRPDGITKDLFDTLSDCGVSRISLNPQTLNNKTLERVGRMHTAEEFLQKYELARKYNFAVNSDLIAALSGEDAEDFRHSLDVLISLAPENITVHTLALKRGSVMTEKKEGHTEEGVVKEMVAYSQSALTHAGYLPYYMYRQKYMAGNLENVGFSLAGHECIYNVDMMEESTNIIACGAGAISKRVTAGGDSVRIERAPNVKDIMNYLTRTKEMIERKERLFKES